MSEISNPTNRSLSYCEWLDREISELRTGQAEGRRDHRDFGPSDWILEGMIEGLRLARHAATDDSLIAGCRCAACLAVEVGK